jgi:predicted TIM-barrel fold metal-dependent hydrolase
MSRRRIIDAHHHLWDLKAVHYPWLMAEGVRRFFGDPAPIQKDYRVDDLREDAADYQLAGSVHIQVGCDEGQELLESAWVQRCSDEIGLPSAIVAFCDLSKPDAQSVLSGQREFANVRGIRQITGRSAEEDAQTGTGGLLNDVVWKRNLATLAEQGLSFDLQLVPGQVRDAARVLEKNPGLKVALCHCGSPWDQSADGLSSWRDGLAVLAELPNVYCKISGLGMFNHNWSAESIRPIVESCIEIFTPKRCMFGSNFPVDKLHGSYTDVWRAFEKIASQFREEEQDALFADTATQFYDVRTSTAS